jgi:hypothetical protein
MFDAISAEALKLPRHEATWFLVWLYPIGFWVIFVAMIGVGMAGTYPPGKSTLSAWLGDTAIPWSVPGHPVGRFLIAAYVGVVFAGEYGWNTWKLIVPHRSRSSLIAAKWDTQRGHSDDQIAWCRNRRPSFGDVAGGSGGVDWGDGFTDVRRFQATGYQLEQREDGPEIVPRRPGGSDDLIGRHPLPGPCQPPEEGGARSGAAECEHRPFSCVERLAHRRDLIGRKSRRDRNVTKIEPGRTRRGFDLAA